MGYADASYLPVSSLASSYCVADVADVAAEGGLSSRLVPQGRNSDI